MTSRRSLLLGALAWAAPVPVLAQAQPALPRTITLVVPFGPGTVVDIMGRAFADPFRAALGGQVNVVVLNREGGGGTIGAAAVAQTRPDGATLGFGPSGMPRPRRRRCGFHVIGGPPRGHPAAARRGDHAGEGAGAV